MKHSTEFAALELTDRTMTQMENVEIPTNIFLDLPKPFDTVDHTILLTKLDYYCLKGVALDLVRHYLTYKKQHVEIEDIIPNMLNISTGVPQGLIIIYYINDFAESTKKLIFIMYASH